jgi:hypothetical protein
MQVQSTRGGTGRFTREPNVLVYAGILPWLQKIALHRCP